MNKKFIPVVFVVTLFTSLSLSAMHRGHGCHGRGGWHRGGGRGNGWGHHHGHGMHQSVQSNLDPATTQHPDYVLQFACMSNDQAKVQALLNRPDAANFINSVNQFSKTALDIAVENLNQDIKDLLEANGAQKAIDILATAPNPGELLRQACKMGNKALVQALLGRADVTDFIDEVGKRCKTALQIATHRGHLEIAQLLKDAGATAPQAPVTFVHMPQPGNTFHGHHVWHGHHHGRGRGGKRGCW